MIFFHIILHPAVLVLLGWLSDKKGPFCALLSTKEETYPLTARLDIYDGNYKVIVKHNAAIKDVNFSEV